MSSLPFLQLIAPLLLPRPKVTQQLAGAVNAGMFCSVLAAFCAAALAGILLLGGGLALWAGGLPVAAVLGILGGFVFCALVICVLLAAAQARRVKDMMLEMQSPAMSLGNRAEEVLQAFLQGWETSSATGDAPRPAQTQQTDDRSADEPHIHHFQTRE
jgi:hypothetical protein